MAPKEKATELVDKYYQLFPLQKDVISIYGTLSWDYDNWKQAKKSALITVDELINELIGHDFSRNAIVFWTSVKQEIETL